MLSECGKNDIPRDDGCQTTDTEQDEHGNAGEQEDVFHLVSLPAPRLELQCKHGNLADEQVATDKHGPQDNVRCIG